MKRFEGDLGGEGDLEDGVDGEMDLLVVDDPRLPLTTDSGSSLRDNLRRDKFE